MLSVALIRSCFTVLEGGALSPWAGRTPNQRELGASTGVRLTAIFSETERHAGPAARAAAAEPLPTAAAMDTRRYHPEEPPIPPPPRALL